MGSSPLSRGIPGRHGLHRSGQGIIPALAGNTCPTRQHPATTKDHPRSRGEYGCHGSSFPGFGGSSPLSRGIHGEEDREGPIRRIIPALAGNTQPIKNDRIPGWDHPRSRGEYCLGWGCLAAEKGSSPLSRGIPTVTAKPNGSGGIIPALAGNTLPWRVVSVTRPDHPRSRGEYQRGEFLVREFRGSSPLSRGIPRFCGIYSICGRIIPALAGNTAHRFHSPPHPLDHPRSRGEYLISFPITSFLSGSSPLSRGILEFLVCTLIGVGIIPALAGNTTSWRRPPPSPGDHPRSRGEYIFGMSLRFAASGSSPLSRGIRSRISPSCWIGGIIPALAGNTFSSRLWMVSSGDHPRSRGEYRPEVLPPQEPYGSSPLSRGIPDVVLSPGPRKGIIPALAGNTFPQWMLLSMVRDHPRSRGEYDSDSATEWPQRGSSPLSRGIPKRKVTVDPESRIIPALAGNTGGDGGHFCFLSDHPRSRGEYVPPCGPEPCTQGSSPLSRGIHVFLL